MPESPKLSNKGALLVVVVAVVILSPLGYSIVSSLLAQGAETTEVFLERPGPEYESCVRETTYMRFHHWELLREVREEIVRYGIRGDVGLYKCKECHTSRERFCNQCHDAVSASLDCFGCHYYP